ncbi:MCE family protein [Nocardioides humilatus]|uniref:MCE family protein n=1 Tax=Nocardioides humilatus TaxID=2607660 RepID=A0A5B1LID4_9ACTN|nr:MCE family protein [Nocardioides humilatus]KAA1419347.1 MCE family protein [Nocardioides humilatus]
MRRRIDLALGLLHIGLGVLVLAGSIAVYQKVFTDQVRVTVETSDVGNALRPGSEVKYLGVPVGVIDEIRPEGDGAILVLALDADRARTIPRAAVVRMVPETLFGERAVSIVQADAGGETGLRDGDELHQDASDEALGVEQVFDSLLPVLTAVQPAELNAALTELATALRGQGAVLGDAMEEWGAYLERLNPEVPALTRDLDHLGEVARTYADAAPDLLAAMDDLSAVSRIVVDRKAELADLLGSVTAASSTTSGWLEPEVGTVVGLAAQSRAVLEILEHYAPSFPCLGKALADLIPRTDAALGAGTDEPGLHVELAIVPARAAYRPGDRPHLVAGAPARCPGASGSTDPRLSGLPAWTPLVVGPLTTPAGAR